MRALLTSLVIVAIGAGCVSHHMRQFIGHDARDVALEDGPPVYVFDLADGQRAFQYRFGGGRVQLPQTATTTGSARIIGNAVYYSAQQVGSPAIEIDAPGCIVTYLARWNGSAWIVATVRYPQQAVC